MGPPPPVRGTGRCRSFTERTRRGRCGRTTPPATATSERIDGSRTPTTTSSTHPCRESSSRPGRTTRRGVWRTGATTERATQPESPGGTVRQGRGERTHGPPSGKLLHRACGGVSVDLRRGPTLETRVRAFPECPHPGVPSGEVQNRTPFFYLGRTVTKFVISSTLLREEEERLLDSCLPDSRQDTSD